MSLLSNLETETVDRCPLCGSEGRPDSWFAGRLGLEAPFDVKRCVDCSMRWLSPRPTPEAYEKLYAYDAYFEGSEAVECYEELARERLPYFSRRVAFIESLFPEERPLRVLDIGAATGEFVAAARARGHDATGIELSTGAIARAEAEHGLKLLNEPVEEHLERHRYDVIHMNHVLEHMGSPTDIARRVSSSLLPEGIWAIEVPQQFENDLDRLRYWSGLRKPEFTVYSLHHTVFFRMQHLEALVRNAGLDVVMQRTANPWRTPIWPPNLRNLVLRVLLGTADRLHGGGNILELYARKKKAK